MGAGPRCDFGGDELELNKEVVILIRSSNEDIVCFIAIRNCEQCRRYRS